MDRYEDTLWPGEDRFQSLPGQVPDRGLVMLREHSLDGLLVILLALVWILI